MQVLTQFVLASASPRRRELLSVLGIDALVVPSGVEESTSETEPGEIVRTLAARKARAVASRYPKAIVLGADTIVVLDDAVLGKPSTNEEARIMLRRLSGRTHEVYTGIALIQLSSGRHAAGITRTSVAFAPLSDDEIDAYVATGSPLDKAGSYGIQDDVGALLVESISGDYYNVVGLPLRRLYELLVGTFGDRVGLTHDIIHET